MNRENRTVRKILPCTSRSALRALVILIFTPVPICLSACTSSRVSRGETKPPGIQLRNEMLAKTLDAAEPGPEHERLQALIGDWKAETIAWRGSGAAAEQGKGTLSNFWMLDGRFVGQEYKSRAQRPKYQGLGGLGYDNIRKLYTSVWLDTTSTSVYTATGSCDASGSLFTLEGVYQDPVTGTPVRCRSITRIFNTNKYTFELFKEGPDRKVFKALEITYTRK